MKNLMLLFASLFVFNLGFGQEYDELRIMFVDEDYPKLLKVAERYTMSDKTKNDAEPYLWLAQGLYAMSRNEEYANQEIYKNSFKDCLSWLGKYYKKDQSMELLNQKIHAKFIKELKGTMFELVETDFASGNYSKANSNTSKIIKVSPKNFGQYFLLGAIKFHSKDNTGAKSNWKKAEELMAEIEAKEDIADWDLEDRKILALGMMETAKCHLAKKPDLAKVLLEKGKDWFEDIDWFMEFYEENN
jgi:tetratricopeptide (TPR) repeat protein